MTKAYATECDNCKKKYSTPIALDLISDWIEVSIKFPNIINHGSIGKKYDFCCVECMKAFIQRFNLVIQTLDDINEPTTQSPSE